MLGPGNGISNKPGTGFLRRLVEGVRDMVGEVGTE